MKKYHIKLNEKVYEIEVTEVAADEEVVVASPAKAETATPSTSAAGSGTEIVAPLPGTVLNINVQAGEQVKAGDIVMILEAMKLENEIVAPADGKIDRITVDKGTSVSTGDCLLVMA